MIKNNLLKILLIISHTHLQNNFHQANSQINSLQDLNTDDYIQDQIDNVLGNKCANTGIKLNKMNKTQSVEQIAPVQ